jgi:hypothetical protein
MKHFELRQRGIVLQTREVEVASDRRKGDLSPPNTIYITFFLLPI